MARRPSSTSPRPRFLLLVAASIALAALISGCDHHAQSTESDIRFRRAATVQSGQLDEISGLQASHRHAGILWVHNDDGEPRVHALGTDGSDQGHFDITDAVNVDWEDMARIPGTDRDLFVLADIGDNDARRSNVWLYIVPEPDPDPGQGGRFHGEQAALNWISLTYPDGPRDAEAITWDPLSNRLLILTKRDKSPRLYAVDGEVALTERKAELIFLGEIDSLRPPEPADRRIFGDRTKWLSQPTGLDISNDGRRAALITYRSLYLFDAPVSGNWALGLNAEPLEILGPGRTNEESVGFKPDGSGLWVSTEGDHAPLFEFVFSSESDEH